MTGRLDRAPARDAGFTSPASPPDRTSAWLVLGTLAALAVLIWAAWADTHQPSEPPLRPTIHPARIPAPDQERALARLEQPEEQP